MGPFPHAMRLAEAVVGRLYHDLSGSLGAVLNGLDLASRGEGVADEAMLIAADAAREVAARLRLARAVWNHDGPVDTADLPSLADGLPNRARLELDLSGLAAGSLPPPAARLLLVLLIMAAEALHGRGTIALAGDPRRELLITIAGVRAAWPAELPEMIAQPDLSWPVFSPTSLAPRLAVLLAREAASRLSLLLATGPAQAPPLLLLALPG
jgi:hypothetical protein